MEVLINHCWCSDSNWGGNYRCRVIVNLGRIEDGKTYYDPPPVDWTNLVEVIPLKREKFDDPHSTVKINVNEIETEYTTIFGNTKKRKEKDIYYYLEFSKELTEDELNMWRMFKIGYLCGYSRGIQNPIDPY